MNDTHFKRVIILTEGGRGLGTGHISRCTSIYQAFERRGITPEIIVNGDDSVEELLDDKKYRIFNWIKDQRKLFSMIDGADIIIDSYLANIGFYKKVSELADLPVYLDDTMRLNYPRGVVINGGIFAEKIGYQQREDIVYLLGPGYAPLREEFWDVPEKEIRKDIENVMITFGGDDKRGMTFKVLRLLVEMHPKLIKNVVIGKGFQNISEIEQFGDKNTNLIYSPGADGMKKIMIESDIAICAGGQTLYELARVGVPTIAVAIVDNQMNNVKGWQEVGFIDYAGWWEDKDVFENIHRSIIRLRDSATREKRYQRGKKVIDGKGAQLIVDILLNTEGNR